MKTRLLVLSLAVICLSTGQLLADMWPTYGNITPAYFGDGGAALQDALDDVTVGGVSSVGVTTDAILDEFDSYWKLVDSAGGSATMIFELGAGFASVNVFGIYDAADPSKMAQVFIGTDTEGYTARVSFNASGRIVVNRFDVDGLFLGGVVGPQFATNQFGFFLTSPEGTFFSDSALNTADGGLDHMYAYQGTGQDDLLLPGMGFPTTWTDGGFVLGWEDLLGGGDSDYEDMVLMVESIHPVPIPAAVLLGLLGFGAAGLGLKLRRFA